MTRLAIIDGDVLCYHACKPRWETKAQIKDGTSFISLDDDGKRIAFEYTKEEDEQYMIASWNNFKKDLSILLDTVFCDEYVMAVKGPYNYRDTLYPEYKLHRVADPSKYGDFVPVLRQLAVQEDLAISAIGREADDLVRIWAIQAAQAGREYIICSIDKDLQCIPGMHWLMHKKAILEVTPESATQFYYEQLLMGDPTDNVPGVPRIGKKTAAKMIIGVTNEEELQEIVVSAYIAAYGDEWREYLLSNGKMIHIQRHEHDFFQISDWPVVKSLL